MAGIALPNDPSVALHERFGFSKVAHFKDVGFKVQSVDRRRLLATHPLDPTATRRTGGNETGK
jgi:hypothetical protein